MFETCAERCPMESDTKPSGLSALDRYLFETQILTDRSLGKWFVAICNGEESPSVRIASEKLALMEQRGLVSKSDFGWRLRPDGRDFARKLGLLPGPAPAEADPDLATARSLRVRNIKDVWQEYRRNKTETLRNTLIEHYLHLVRYNAERIHVKLPDEVELDDLMSAGIFGLMDAINAFDPERGVRFETYCAPRIRGAILDELRSMDWVPRLVRSRAHKLNAATKQLEVELGRAPTNKEVAMRLKLPMAEFKKLARDASAVGLVSLSRKWFETDSNEDVREIDRFEDDSADPVSAIHRIDLEDLMKGLSGYEQIVIKSYYFEEKTMKEIGAMLDLSESRVSQIHSSVMARLKATLADRQKDRETTSDTAHSNTSE